MSVVFWKELADHFRSWRFLILLILILLIGLWATYASGQAIRQNTDTIPAHYVFLLLLTSSETVFSLATFLGFFGPLVGITLGFDSISGEYARGTLSRVLSQPIYRDGLINGKFFAGLATVAVLWGSILLLVIGLGITLLGFPPNAEELWRMLIFTAVGVFYVGFWLALALLFSLLFQKTVTAALASMAVWLFMSLFVSIFSQAIAGIVVPDPSTPEQLAYQTDIVNIINRISPSTLFSESVSILLNPAARVFGLALQSQAQGILPTPLALDQSLILIWPHITTLFGLVAVCFGISYIIFMRAEIRA
ncbi:MAG: ABC transporter permease [Deltaproteobacteria bacterium]|nr:ABC transporter permease [Deltaproteobacteria bacterium]MDZ4343910.1 ABC transporter permease [Candidatus Binatia bacterium]